MQAVDTPVSKSSRLVKTFINDQKKSGKYKEKLRKIGKLSEYDNEELLNI